MNVIDFFKTLRTTKIGSKPWFSDYAFDKSLQLSRWKFRASMRKGNGFMGRFGGGWQVKFGFQWGGSTVVFSLFVMDISISKTKKEEVANSNGNARSNID